MDERPDKTTPRALQIVLAVVLTLSFVGFAVGTRGTDTVSEPAAHEPPIRHADVPDARSYTELREAPPTAAITWPQAEARLGAEAPPQGERDLDALRVERDLRRAYDGAPPTVPHPVVQRDVGSCLSCHQQGLSVGKKVASTMSHDFKSQCLQCHAQASGTGTAGDVLLADALAGQGTYGSNVFAGYRGPTTGDRAWDIAPPEIPHRTFMRENCLSCHAEGGSAPLRTTHPERASCQQCHVPSASLDQRRDPAR